MFRLNLKRVLAFRRFKIFAIISIIAVVVLALAITFGISFSETRSFRKDAAHKSSRSFADQSAAKQYEWQQQKLKNALKNYFDKAIAAGEIVGAGVSIVSGDSVVFSDGFGKRNINENDLVNSQTLFRLGSLSKGFTGILAASLKNEGKIRWEDKVSDYIPQFRLGDENNTDKITLSTILSHSSGAPYHSYTNLVEAGLPLTDIANRFKDVKPVSAPGTLYSYQNALFALSEEMMRKVTGHDITTLLENRFFNPLEMCSIIMDYENLAKANNVALPHIKRRKGWNARRLTNSYYNAVAAGGINATALDMAKWMRFILGNNPEIMSELAIKEAFSPKVEIKGRSKYYQRWPGHLSSHYALGWRVHKFLEDDTTQEQTIWHHGGSVNNYRNEIAVYPEADLGICVLLNSNSRLARTVIPDLYEIVKSTFDRSSAKPVYSGIATAIPQF